MQPEDLATALQARGLLVTTLDDGHMTVRRPGCSTLMAETISVEDERVFWSWGTLVPADTVEAAACLIDRVVSPSEVRNTI